MENKHTPPLPWVYTEDEKAEMFSIHTLDADPIDGPNEFIACGIWYQSAGAETGKAIAELIVNSVNSNASLQSEIDRLKNDLLDALDLKEGNGPTALSMLKGEIDRLKEEKKEWLAKVQEVITLGFQKFSEQKRYIEELPILERYLLDHITRIK